MLASLVLRQEWALQGDKWVQRQDIQDKKGRRVCVPATVYARLCRCLSERSLHPVCMCVCFSLYLAAQVFLRETIEVLMEKARAQELSNVARVIQAWVLGFLQRSVYLSRRRTGATCCCCCSEYTVVLKMGAELKVKPMMVLMLKYTYIYFLTGCYKNSSCPFFIKDRGKECLVNGRHAIMVCRSFFPFFEIE